jgi:hypothetical protein
LSTPPTTFLTPFIEDNITNKKATQATMDSNLQQRLAHRFTGTEMYGTLIVEPKEVETKPSADRLKNPTSTTNTTHGIRWFGPIDEVRQKACGQK